MNPPSAKTKGLLKQTQVFASSPQGGKDSNHAVLNIGASYAPRRWPLKSFMEIAEKLAGQGWSVTILGGPAETDARQELENLKPDNNRINIAIDKFSFDEVRQLIAGSDLVISNDSGLGHLAIMLEKPTVIMLGGGHYGAFMPYPPDLTPAHVRFLTHPMPCYHCNWNCTEMPQGGKTFPCVNSITADQTWNAIKDLVP
jgi:ADP-heptose:LPS heptosyltransferase